MENPDLKDIYEFLLQLAKDAGQMITTARPSMGDAGTKKNCAPKPIIEPSDIVTETDKAVENKISSALKTRYPTYSFLGEESFQPGMRLTDSPTFVVDPIDGTTNFVHSYPYISISMAFTQNKIPLIGVVYNPFTGYLYHAISGGGAFVTHALPASAVAEVGASEITRKLPLRAPSDILKLDRALVAVEWGNERDGSNFECKVKTFRALAASKDEGGGMVHSLRSLGSAALNCCAVAAGEMDAYWEGGCWAWDIGAGWVVLTEAGGRVVGGNPGEWKIPVDGRRYLAVRGTKGGKEESDAFIEEFWGCIKGKLEYEL